MDLPKKITLGKLPDGKPVEYDVVAPTSMATRYDLSAAAFGPTRHRACAASVALCCPVLARHLRVAYKGDVVAYGGEVIDAFDRLVKEHGVKLQDPAVLIHQGLPLLGELVTGLWSAAEVDAAEDFTEATPEASTS